MGLAPEPLAGPGWRDDGSYLKWIGASCFVFVVAMYGEKSVAAI